MIDKLIKITYGLFLFLLPLYFLSIGNTAIDVDKQALLVMFSLLFGFLFVLKGCSDKKLTIIKTPFDAPIILLSSVYLISAVFIAPNKINAFTLPFSAGTILALTILYFSLTHLYINKLQPLLISSVIVALLSILTQFRLIPAIWPLGDNLSTSAFLLPLAAFLLTDIILGLNNVTRKQFVTAILKILPALSVLLLITTSLTVSAYFIIANNSLSFLPFRFGWSIMMETYKNFQQFLFGVGPSNFNFAFTSGKPLAINLTNYWNIISPVSSNLILHFSTEAGILAGIALLYIFYKILYYFTSSNTQKISKPLLISLITIIVIQFLLPPNLPLFILLIILLAIFTPKIEFRKIRLSENTAYYFLVPATIIFLGFSYWTVKIYFADIFFRRATASVNTANFGATYNLAQKAITINPYSDRYFAFSGALNLAIANSLTQGEQASSSASQISQLTSQSINYASKAVELNSQNSQNWGQLGSIYQALVGNLDKADQLAYDAYNRQISLDPNSPVPKITTGGFLTTLKQYDAAYLLFLQANNLKPDWNNVHYNLAYLLTKMQKYPQAAAELQATLDLTPQDTEDYKKVQQELESMKALLPKESSPSALTETVTATPSAKPVTPTIKAASDNNLNISVRHKGP